MFELCDDDVAPVPSSWFSGSETMATLRCFSPCILSCLVLSGCAKNAPPPLIEPLQIVERMAPLRVPDLRLGSAQFRDYIQGRALVFSASGRSIYSGGRDGYIREWDVGTGQLLRSLNGHKGPVLALALAPNGRTLASGGYDGTVHLWDLVRSTEVWQIEAHSDGVHTLEFAIDGQTLLSASQESKARLWNAVTGRRLHSLDPELDKPEPCWGATFLPDGTTVAIRDGFSGPIRIWDIRHGRQTRTIVVEPNLPGGVSIRSPDGELAYAGSVSICGTFGATQRATLRLPRRLASLKQQPSPRTANGSRWRDGTVQAFGTCIVGKRSSHLVRTLKRCLLSLTHQTARL